MGLNNHKKKEQTPRLIDYTELSEDGEDWEQFAAEFLATLGLATESPPDRGADGGKDLLMIEELSGNIQRRTFRWLISCKNLASSNVAVSEITHEKNILERVKAFNADGFLGFYSTVPTSGLNTRLRALTDNGSLTSYKIFNGRLIENELLTLGKSILVRRYFPKSYKRVRPLHKVIDDFVSLDCDFCNRDLLQDLYSRDYGSLIAEVRTKPKYIAEVYFACKGECDKILQKRMWEKHKQVASWKDISDLAMPNEYLRWLMSLVNNLHDGVKMDGNALEKHKDVIMALSQKVFREVTETERKRLRTLMSLPF